MRLGATTFLFVLLVSAGTASANPEGSGNQAVAPKTAQGPPPASGAMAGNAPGTAPATTSSPITTPDTASDAAGPVALPQDGAALPEAPPPPLPPLPSVDDAAARVEANTLAVALRREVPNLLPLSAARRARWIALTQAEVEQAGYAIHRAQTLVVVDRNPGVQQLALVLALPDSEAWQVIGSVRVSTGTTGRKYYYITPTGVFPNTTERLGYRAQGTKNENGVRGNGSKGMRVWDLGWQWAEKGWREDREKGQIRLEVHATDPQLLEWRLGHPASEGCVRIPSAFNVFLDRHGLLDVEYEQAASQEIRFRALLRPDRVPSPIAGMALVVVDSGQHDANAGHPA